MLAYKGENPHKVIMLKPLILEKVEERPGVGRVLLASIDIAPWHQVNKVCLKK